MEYAVILDYTTGEVYCDKMNSSDCLLAEQGTEEFLSHYGFNPDSCYVMWTPIEPTFKSYKE